MMGHRNLLTNATARLRAWRFLLVATAVVLSLTATAPAGIIPIFYNSLDSDAAVTSADYGAGSAGSPQNVANHDYTLGVSGNALRSLSSNTNAGRNVQLPSHAQYSADAGGSERPNATCQ